MITLNLLPDVKKDFIKATRNRIRVVTYAIAATVIVVVAVGFLAAYVYGAQKIYISTQTSDIKKKYQELQKVEDLDKYLTIQNQLKNLSSLHEGKNDFSRLLDYLPALNPQPPKNVVLSGLDLTAESKELILKGNISDFDALTTFKDTLANAKLVYSDAEGKETKELMFSNQVINNASYSTSDQSTVSFTITLTYNDNAFLNSLKNARIEVPNKETTQSVANTPQSIFQQESTSSSESGEGQ